MSMQHDDSNLADRLKSPVWVMRTIIAGLVLGATMFAGVAIFLVQMDQGLPGNGLDVMVPIAIGYALFALVASQVVPRIVAASSRRSIARGTYPSASSGRGPQMPEGAAGQLCLVYQTKMIIGAAFLEGAVLFNMIAYLLTGNPISLGTGIGLIIATLGLLPSSSRVAGWIEDQLHQLADDRAIGN